MKHIRLFAAVLISVLVVFLPGGLSSELGVGMDPKTLKPVSETDLANRAKDAAMNTVIKTAADTAILGKPAGEAFIDNLRSNLSTQTQSALASAIGDAKIQGNISDLEHKSLHAIAAAGSAAISGNNVGAAALAAPASEAVAEWASNCNLNKYQAADLGKVLGASTGIISGDVASAYASATNAVENNFLLTPLDVANITLDVGTVVHEYLYGTNEELTNALIALGVDLIPGTPAGSGKAIALLKSAAKEWSPKIVNGWNVYQRNDLIDPHLIDSQTGLSNLDLMKQGRAPIGKDGKPIQLHHITQQELNSFKGELATVVEISTTQHQKNGSILHINMQDKKHPEMNKGIDNSSFRTQKMNNNDGSREMVRTEQSQDFERYRKQYWKDKQKILKRWSDNEHEGFI